MKFGLSQPTIEMLKGVFAGFPQIEQVVIYGSRAKGCFREGSDIDLAIVAPSMSHSELMKLEDQIDNLMLPYEMDLALLHHIENSDLIDHIQRVGQTFFNGSTLS